MSFARPMALILAALVGANAGNAAAQETPQPLPPPATPATVTGADPDALGVLIQKLSPESRRALGGMLANDWKEPPEWVEMLSVLLRGDPIRLGAGWFQTSRSKYDWRWFAERYDANKDGLVAADELPKDVPYAEQLLNRLDRDFDGQLQAADFDHFGRVLPTPPSMMARFMATMLDTDSNGKVTADELAAWLKRADKENAGFVTPDDFLADFTREFNILNQSEAMPSAENMLKMFLRGELGTWTSGPRPGEEAPDFTLPVPDGSRTVTLSQTRGKPVVLIFGSFT